MRTMPHHVSSGTVKRLLLHGLMLYQLVHAATDYSIEWISNGFAVLADKRTVVLQFEYQVGNIQECNNGNTESCVFRPSVHTESPEGTCSTDPLTLDAIIVRPLEITTSSVNLYIEVDALAAADANFPGLIVDNVLSLCVQLDSFALDGTFLVNSLKVIQRAALSVTGSFVSTPVTTEAGQQVRDVGDNSAFQIPVMISQCSEQRPLVRLEDGVNLILEVCVASDREFAFVSTLLEAKVERPTTSVVQTLIENGSIVDNASTVLECSNQECLLRTKLDLVTLGQVTGTLRFYGVAVMSVNGGRRQLGFETQEQSFDFEFELREVPLAIVSSVAPSVDWIKHDILLLLVTAVLMLCFG